MKQKFFQQRGSHPSAQKSKRSLISSYSGRRKKSTEPSGADIIYVEKKVRTPRKRYKGSQAGDVMSIAISAHPSSFISQRDSISNIREEPKKVETNPDRENVKKKKKNLTSTLFHRRDAHLDGKVFRLALYDHVVPNYIAYRKPLAIPFAIWRQVGVSNDRVGDGDLNGARVSVLKDWKHVL